MLNGPLGAGVTAGSFDQAIASRRCYRNAEESTAESKASTGLFHQAASNPADMEPQMIESKPALRAFIDNLPECKDPDPSLFVDLEGNNLSRKGTLSLVTVLVEPRHTVHLIDVTGLGDDAFTTAGLDGRTIKRILESPKVCKVFFDIRNDSDALYSLSSIRVQGIEHLQLMELASRASWKKYVNGLSKCIERDAPISFEEKQR